MPYNKPVPRVDESQLIEAGVDEQDAKRLAELYAQAEEIDKLFGKLCADAEVFATEVLTRPGARNWGTPMNHLRQAIPDHEANYAREHFRHEMQGHSVNGLRWMLSGGK